MFKINLSGNNKICGAQKIGGHCPGMPPVAMVLGFIIALEVDL